jgi:hypothetical protein
LLPPGLPTHKARGPPGRRIDAPSDRGAARVRPGGRVILSEFEIQVTLWKRDHDPRFAIDSAFELTDYPWPTDGETDIWAIYSSEAPATLVLRFSSSA